MGGWGGCPFSASPTMPTPELSIPQRYNEGEVLGTQAGFPLTSLPRPKGGEGSASEISRPLSLGGGW